MLNLNSYSIKTILFWTHHSGKRTLWEVSLINCSLFVATKKITTRCTKKYIPTILCCRKYKKGMRLNLLRSFLNTPNSKLLLFLDNYKHSIVIIWFIKKYDLITFEIENSTIHNARIQQYLQELFMKHRRPNKRPKKRIEFFAYYLWHNNNKLKNWHQKTLLKTKLTKNINNPDFSITHFFKI